MIGVFGVSSFENIMSLIGLLAIFMVILATAYFMTKWLGKSNFLQTANRNITVIETFRMNQNSVVQIIKVGSRYFLIGVSKENIEYLTELNEEELSFPSFDVPKTNEGIDFKEILNKVRKKQK